MNASPAVWGANGGAILRELQIIAAVAAEFAGVAILMAVLALRAWRARGGA